MKTARLLLLFCAFSFSAYAQIEEEVDIVEDVLLIESEDTPPLEAEPIPEKPQINDKKMEELPEVVKNHPFLGYQHQVNEVGMAEAYPWLSADAMRLYFTKENAIYMASRGSRYEEFGQATPVSIDDKPHAISAWLTSNELEMYISNGDLIKVYSRQDRESIFLFQRSIDLDEHLKGFISGVSFTPDMRTMIVYNSFEGQRLGIFSMLNNTVQSLLKIVESPMGEMAVGQISKDGKWLYFSVDEDPSFSLYKVQMSTLITEQPEYVKILSLKGLRIGKPSVSYDETYLAFNATASNLWQNNEILIVDMNNLSFIQEDKEIFELSENPTTAGYTPVLRDMVPTKPQVLQNTEASSFDLQITRLYPNPTQSEINLKYQLPINCQVVELFVNDVQGREIMRRKLNVQQKEFSFSLRDMGLPKGNYVLWINTELGNSSVHKFVYH